MDDTTLYNAINILRKNSDSFNTLVSNIDTKFEEFITDFQSKVAVNGWETLVKLKVPYIKIGTKEKDLLEQYLCSKYGVFGGYFDIKKCLFSKYFIIRNHL